MNRYFTMKDSLIKYSENLSYVIANGYEKDSAGEQPTDTFAIVCGTGSCTDEHIVIPPIYRGFPVKCLGYSPMWCEYDHYDTLIIDCESNLICYPDRFYADEKVKSITIPNSIVLIAPGAFVKLKQSIEVNIVSDNKNYYSDSNCIIQKNHISNHSDYVVCGCANCVIPNDEKIEYISAYAFKSQTGIENIKIPFNISIIGEEAFADSDIKNIEFEGVELIDDRAFAYCKHLTNFTIPNSIRYIGQEAFAYCSNITELCIPYGVSALGANRGRFVANNDKGARIGEAAFRNCCALKSVRLPKTILYFKSNVFMNCVNLETIYYEGTLEEWNNIIKPTTFDNYISPFSKFMAIRVICTDGTTETMIYYNS